MFNAYRLLSNEPGSRLRCLDFYSVPHWPKQRLSSCFIGGLRMVLGCAGNVAIRSQKGTTSILATWKNRIQTRISIVVVVVVVVLVLVLVLVVVVTPETTKFVHHVFNANLLHCICRGSDRGLW